MLQVWSQTQLLLRAHHDRGRIETSEYSLSAAHILRMVNIIVWMSGFFNNIFGIPACAYIKTAILLHSPHTHMFTPMSPATQLTIFFALSNFTSCILLSHCRYLLCFLFLRHPLTKPTTVTTITTKHITTAKTHITTTSATTQTTTTAPTSCVPCSAPTVSVY